MKASASTSVQTRPLEPSRGVNADRRSATVMPNVRSPA
ncbi:uncharacterized protein METZ01_LOCUS363721, partial [marine metagenome]